MSEHVILLHGIWMRSVTLVPMARRLRAMGYTVEAIDYASVFGEMPTAVTRVRERMLASDAETVHLVGHSLGGLVAVEAVRDPRELPPGRVVCLGPPLRGSATARRLARIPGGTWLMGRGARPLMDGLADWTGAREVGVIGGNVPVGLGVAIRALGVPSDGTVALEETRLPGINGHCIVAASHTGLPFSSEVAGLTADFLRDGHFALDRGRLR